VVSTEAQGLIDQWMAQASELGSVETDSLRTQLRFMKSISIGRGIRAVVGRHLGSDRAREAQRLYGVRSKLVHDGKRPDDLAGEVRALEKIARDLLVSLLTART
jgi:hypothetical protein